MKLDQLACALLLSSLGAFGCGSEDPDFDAQGGRGGSSGQGGSGGDDGGAGADAGSGGEGGTDGGVSLSDPDDIRIWANAASALGVYLHVYQPIAVADGEASFADPTCPSTDDDGETLEIAGDCTDSAGAAWVGTASVERTPAGDRLLTLDDFGTNTNGERDTRTGEASVTVVGDMEHEFVIDLVHQGGVRTTVDYAGTVSGDYGARTVWSGTGTVTREGSASPIGTIETTTTEEVVDDDVCSGQPVSGNTALESPSGDRVVITYDGSTDCDMDAAASYSLNGEPQGTIDGVSCSVAPPLRGGGTLAFVFMVLAGMAFGARVGTRKPNR